MAPPAEPSGAAPLLELARALSSALALREADCPGCRNDIVVQIALGVVDRWRFPSPGTPVGVPPRVTWDASVDAVVAIALADMLVGAANPRAGHAADSVTKRYRSCVTELLERLVATHEGPTPHQ